MRSTPQAASGEYLTTAEAAALLRVRPARLGQLRRAGLLRQGVHWTVPPGMGRRWLRSGLEAFVKTPNQVRAGTGRARSRLNPALLRR